MVIYTNNNGALLIWKIIVHIHRYIFMCRNYDLLIGNSKYPIKWDLTQEFSYYYSFTVSPKINN